MEHPSAVAYCLPGRVATIVLTSGALAALNDDEIRAVLAHEKAHLRGRHHLVLAAADAVATTLPFVPSLRRAREEQARLLEMLADDAAAQSSGRLAVARALVSLAEVSVPVATLGASNVTSFARAQRLLHPSVPISFVLRASVAVTLVLLTSVPVLLLFAPLFAASRLGVCSLASA
jgi:Zn-dependent protease with chaperone function